MGLHVTSVAQITSAAPHLTGINYFVYILNYYNINDDVIEALVSEIPALEQHFGNLGNALVVSSVKNIDFANDVLSWHNCFGGDASEVCPAILICTLPPQYFLEESVRENDDGSRPWILLKLREHCNDAQEIKFLLQRIVEEISKGSDISDFEPSALLKHNKGRPVISGELTYMGIKLNHGEIFRRIFSQIKR